MRRKIAFAVVAVFVFTMCFAFNTTTVSAAVSANQAYQSQVLKKGMEGSAVSALQSDLKILGFLSIEPTGYYGDITASAVSKLQTRYGLKADGIAGSATFTLINKLLGRNQTAVSRGSTGKDAYLVSWFGGVENIFQRGDTATVYDIDSGLSFKVKRTYGSSHADCETLTAVDTAVMKKIYGGEWSWQRRAVIITVNGRKIAASMAGMPHAGVDSAAANAYVSWRSGGYGEGLNLDTVKGNTMDGHFDIHFLGSKTHGTDRVDEVHQSMVQKAADWAARNY